MSHSPSHPPSSSSYSATAGLDALTTNSYHDDSSSRFYSHHGASATSSSSSLNPPTSATRSNQPQNPQASESHTVQSTGAATIQGHVSDAWAEHGHFPLALDSVSRSTVPVRGGSTILLKGDNFRAGVQVVIACASLGESKLDPKIVTPRVLKSTEMEFVVPNLLDWWASSATAIIASKTLQLSATLTCEGGVKDSSDPVVAFDMVAVEDSETELLHTIIGLHRQFIHTSLTADLDGKLEQSTLALLNLDQPPTVTRSEHLALGVIYMLCNGRDLISDDGMDIVRSVTEDGHDMLHLAVVLGLKTLVRELARHLLGIFQSCATTSESEVFTRDSNDLTALDFATLLGHAEIEKVLAATLQAAQDHKRSILGRAARPLPSIPPPQPSLSATQGTTPPTPSKSSTLGDSPVLPDLISSAITAESVDRPLPPTPLTSPYKDSPPETRGNHSYFPTMAGIDATLMSHSPPSTEATAASTATAEHHPPQRVNTAQAITEEGNNYTTQHHGGVPSTTAEHTSTVYPGQIEPHIVTHQFPTYESQHRQPQHQHNQHAQWQQHQHQHPMLQPHYYPSHSQPTHQQQHDQPLHAFVQHAPTLPNMPHLQAHGHHLNPPRPELPAPPRVNSVPTPRPNNSHSSSPQQHQEPLPILEGHSLLATSPAGTYRPLPTASFKPPSTLPPPKHKVTRVNRPKNFVVPTSASETTPTMMPAPEFSPTQQHRPMMIPPLLPGPSPHPHLQPQSHHYPHQYPVGNSGHDQHHPMLLPMPVHVPIAHQGNHVAHRQDSNDFSRQDDQIKVPITHHGSHMPQKQNTYSPPRHDDQIKVHIA
ncbi:hypothetical protein BGW39_007696 [Mortierella sp. 14UC]|nr:hypothetical protein BGW39_007696 [Mortierella sp. 14UC]